jgi:hypothetical protein
MLKSIKKFGILVLIAMMIFTSCMDKHARKNNYPVPNVDFTLPVGDVYTIDTLLYMWHAEGTHKFTQDASVYGIVIGDETSGNIYKASFIKDGDAAIELYMKSTSGLRDGDSIRVYLKGATLSEYSGTPQIQDLDPNNITILANNIPVEPEELNTLDVNTNYICHLSAIRREKLFQIGLLKSQYDGSQDYELNLRAVEHHLKFVHIPKVLYHWRYFRKSLSNANNEKCMEAGRSAVQAFLDRQKIPASVERQNYGRNRIRYEIYGRPLVSVITDDPERVAVSYPNTEVCGHAEEAAGEYIAFLHKDLIPDHPDWLEELLRIAQLDSVGAVGGAFFTSHGKVLHRGIHFEDGQLRYTFWGKSEHDPCYFNKAICVHNVSAIDGNFCITKTDVYKQYLRKNPEGDFIRFCLSLYERNLRIVYTPYASAHCEKGRAGPFLNQEKYELPFREDPYYNVNLFSYLS